MINRRHTRPSKAVESLQQFCINNSAGVDCTKPHSDVKSVYAAKNLVNNPDGSLSLRKPIVLHQQWPKNVIKTIPTGIDDVFLNIVYESAKSSFNIQSASGNTCAFKLIWRDRDDVEHTVVCGPLLTGARRVEDSIIDFTNAVPVHVGSGTVVLGNCMVNLFTDYMTVPAAGDEANLCDRSLYPASESPYYRPRYVQIEHTPGIVPQADPMWTVRIISPETNEYFVTDNGVSHDVNTLLDNPFAARDTYNAAAAAVKTIRAYVKSDIVNGRIVPVTSGAAVGSLSSSTVTLPSFLNTLPDYGATDGMYGGVSVRFHSFSSTQPSSLNVVALNDWNVNLRAKEVELDTFISSNETGLATHMQLRVSVMVEGVQRDASYARGERFWIGNIDGPISTWLSVSNVTLLIESTKGRFSKTFSNTQFTKCEIPEISAMNNFNTSGTSKVVKIHSDFNAADKTSLVSVLSGNDVSAKVTLEFNDFTVFAHTYPSTDSFDELTVRGLTESVTPIRYRAALTVPPDVNAVVLKAFMTLPRDTSPLYCSWRYSTDGVAWKPVPNFYDTQNIVEVEEPSDAPIESVEATPTESETAYTYRPLGNPSANELCLDRGDCVYLAHKDDDYDYWNGALFKFKVCALDVAGSTAKITATYCEELYTLPIRPEFEFEEADTGNTALGDKRYLNKRLFSFGDSSFKNNVFYSYPGEFTTPLTNAISLASSADDIVTSVSSWRNYIISTTPHAVYLSTPAENGYFTKTINTAIGVPVLDKRCIATVPTGVVFKSGAKIYILYPNAYASDDTFMNVTDISKQVSHILEDYTYDATYSPFSFTTSSEYVLMLPMQGKTLSLKYDLDAHRWNVSEYPTVLTDVRIVSLDDIRLYGVTKVSGDDCICEYVYDADLRTNPDFAAAYNEALPYGDVVYYADSSSYVGVTEIVEELQSDISLPTYKLLHAPIEFELDTGQKTDTILTTKQFVETKLVVATLHKFDTFPMQVLVHIDGTPNIVTRDISTDAPFWKSNADVGVLNTNVYGNDTFNTLRQLILRYSGKGKSIRHILTGSSLCNFKLYEMYIRYKLLNTKQ